MAKRFTDTELWDKEWFMQLSCKHKLLIRYIFDKCDVAGIWQPNWHLASTYMGEKVGAADLLFFKKHIEFLEDGKIFVTDFIDFQYGKLSEDCKPHRPIIEKLKKAGLYEKVLKGYRKGFKTLEEKEQEKEKDKEQENKGGVGGFEISLQTDLPGNVLEAAERNQYTHTKKNNTEFIQSQWKVFLAERMNDPPDKKQKSLTDLTAYFLNWIRTKFPKINGSHKPTSSASRKSAGATTLVQDLKAELESDARRGENFRG